VDPASDPMAGERALTLSIPLVVILAVAVFVACRYLSLRMWQAVLCLVLGFLLAATAAAPEVSQADIYGQLGLELTYHHIERRVEVKERPAAMYVESVREGLGHESR
jgi:hypothetical protein